MAFIQSSDLLKSRSKIKDQWLSQRTSASGAVTHVELRANSPQNVKSRLGKTFTCQHRLSDSQDAEEKKLRSIRKSPSMYAVGLWASVK